MVLAERIQVARRFQRAVRIDIDSNNKGALEGFICPKSSKEVLAATAHHVAETNQGAFTWTGPYGSGKSSLVVALSALLGKDRALRGQASAAIGKKTAKTILKALPPRANGWHILPVVGRRDDPAKVIGEAIEAAGHLRSNKVKNWDDKLIVSILTEIASRDERTEGGLVLFIDEMGKFLEATTQDDDDVYLFQLLAEAASRSGKRFILIGILHQSFEDYARRLSREMRVEWSKIQGRFIDLPVNVVGEEQIELISRAIENNHRSTELRDHAIVVAKEIKRQMPSSSACLPEILEECWPLHPVVACLLGPISRRRFGQNQRSIFGFLNSAEPFGFQDFIRHAKDNEIFWPDQLWNYLRVNLEPSILASPDGHKWAIAAEALERCEAIGGKKNHLKLLKTIALIDLFKSQSGLVPSFTLLRCCTGLSAAKNKVALEQLQKWSLIVYRKFTDAYAVYAGSDFDIDLAVGDALKQVSEVDFSAMRRLVSLQPILAKRHYHETGSLRWFDLNVVSLERLLEKVAAFRPIKGTIGQFLLVIPTEGESRERARAICRQALRQPQDWDIVVGLSKRERVITNLARELAALEQVREEHPDLAGDFVAQREVQARHAVLQGQLEQELSRAFNNITWHLKGKKAQRWSLAELSSLASELADARFPYTPIIKNELLNRIKPSTSATAAQNRLLRHMVENEGEERLGIKGFPAEGGLCISLLEATKLYVKDRMGWQFVVPKRTNDPCELFRLWFAAKQYLANSEGRTVEVAEVFKLWSEPPFGVKDGLMPILAASFILSMRDKISIYRQGVFQPHFKEIDVEMLTIDPSEVQLRWMDLSAEARGLLSSMAGVVRTLDASNSLTHLLPIDVARGLITIYERLQAWTKRTVRLSSNAVCVRNLFKHASDPNKFLFDDIPATFGTDALIDGEVGLAAIVRNVHEGLEELINAYPLMLRKLSDLMLEELQVPNDSPQALYELRARAENVKELGGDFRLESFIARLSTFEGKIADIEGITSFAADKPPNSWTDPDLDRAAIEIADLGQKFIRIESFARVKGRRDKHHAMAVVVGVNGRPAPIHEEFFITDAERQEVDVLITQVEAAVTDAGSERRNVVLAALAELTSRYMLLDENAETDAQNEERAAP